MTNVWVFAQKSADGVASATLERLFSEDVSRSKEIVMLGKFVVVLSVLTVANPSVLVGVVLVELGLVLDRHVPAGEIDQACAEACVFGMKGSVFKHAASSLKFRRPLSFYLSVERLR